jgi:hypothetical protein
MNRLQIIAKEFLNPLHCIAAHISYILQHIPGNALCDAVHIPLHRHRKYLHKCGKHPLLFRFPYSLAVPMHSKWQRIPYPVEYILPSFLHLLPAGMMKRNGYK